VAAGSYHTVGVTAAGRVVAVGSTDLGQCDVADWRQIVAVAAGSTHTLGLRTDGTVVAAGDNEHGQCSVSGWDAVRSPD
jgi:alpha-tubulin suppressor-like RCC1 family protein